MQGAGSCGQANHWVNVLTSDIDSTSGNFIKN